MHLHALVFICLSRSVHLLDDHGNAVTGARVRSRGFDVGQRVERKADGASGVITEITAEHVVLQTAGGQLKEATAEGFVEGLWQKATERQAPEMVHNWATRAGPASVEFQRCLLRSQIFEALRQQHEDLMPDLADAVSVSQKPREIRALQDFAAKGLVMPVTTTRVDIKREEDAEHGAGLIIGPRPSAGDSLADVLRRGLCQPCLGYENHDVQGGGQHGGQLPCRQEGERALPAARHPQLLQGDARLSPSAPSKGQRAGA